MKNLPQITAVVVAFALGVRAGMGPLFWTVFGLILFFILYIPGKKLLRRIFQ